MRAATSGLVDFAKFDPWDRWHWRRLDWLIQETQTQRQAATAELQAQCYAILGSGPALTQDSRQSLWKAAEAALKEAVTLHLCLSPEETRKTSLSTNDVEELKEAYYSVFGRPGEGRYEAMMQAADEILKEAKARKEQQENRPAGSAE